MTHTGNIAAAILGFGITVLLGFVVIPWLKKLNFGQTIREDGPTWHKAKQGTPTMGGIMFAVGVTIATICGYIGNELINVTISSDEMVRLFGGLIMALLFCGIGFWDDYIKVVQKRNLGLTAWQIIIMQTAVTAAYLAVLYLYAGKSTLVFLPYIGAVDFGILYFPIMGILIIGIVNSANLTDGIDGLCTSVTFIIGVFFMAATAYLSMAGMNILATALAGACIGFLVFNLHPARVFMGDTGSFFFGGIVAALGFGLHMEFILFFVAFVYCCESLSVIMQRISFKLTGKRIFKMSPIHHHFEMCGWKENSIVILFTVVTILACFIAFPAIKQLQGLL